ncbi:hypothetical protein D1831_13870 [Lactiplantibacillus garii]|uniref:Lipoprotein n=1 Tax=Lactiplantibacillus garii TaxID=2306423 RepID=A0A3R8KCF6_9LACO|nr:hypothetical protein [Lactiplantibacillus garii]RRK09229.1 hypothetical protein D1831_13870 [Lactiplantibacillus garii]
MKKAVLLSTLLISGLVLTGCQSTSSKATTKNTHSAVTTAVASDLGQVAGKSYSGTHQGKGVADDPTYQYKISFGKNGKFGQVITSSNGYAARFVEQGTYKYDKTNHEIKLSITKVTETSYTSDADLKSSSNPSMLSVRSKDGQSKQTQLTSAENKTLTIEDKGDYLLGTVNNVKLYPDKKPVSDYDKLAQNESKGYSTAAQTVNQKTFYAKLGTSRIWMSFNDDGTWQCRIIDGTHKWDIYDQGTWSVKNGQLSLKPTGDIREYTIVGDTTDPSEYSGVTTNSSRVTDNFTWVIKGSDLVITSKQDASMTKLMQIQTTTVTPTFTKAQKNTKADSKQISNDPFGSEDGFLSWTKSHASSALGGIEKPSDTKIVKYKNIFAENFTSIRAIYVVITETDNYEAPSIIIFADDGNIYSLVKDVWSINDTLTEQLPIVKSDSSSKSNDTESSSESSTSDPTSFNSADEFGKWIDDHYGNSHTKLHASDLSSGNDDYKYFEKSVSGATPLYFAAESVTNDKGNEVVQSVGAEWIYASDGKIYHQLTQGAWHVDTDAMFKFTHNSKWKESI